MAKRKARKAMKTNGENVIPIRPEQVTLPEEIRAEVQALDHAVGVAKIALADLDLQVEEAEKRREQGRQLARAAIQTLVNCVNALATERGINVVDPTKGRWHFDTTAGTFTRLS